MKNVMLAAVLLIFGCGASHNQPAANTDGANTETGDNEKATIADDEYESESESIYRSLITKLIPLWSEEKKRLEALQLARQDYSKFMSSQEYEQAFKGVFSAADADARGTTSDNTQICQSWGEGT